MRAICRLVRFRRHRAAGHVPSQDPRKLTLSRSWHRACETPMATLKCSALLRNALG